MSKRCVALFLTCMLLLVMLPAVSFAADTENTRPLQALSIGNDVPLYYADADGTPRDALGVGESPSHKYYAATVEGTETELIVSCSEQYVLQWYSEVAGWSGSAAFIYTQISAADGDPIHIKIADANNASNAEDYYIFLTWGGGSGGSGESSEASPYSVALSASAPTVTVDESWQVELRVTHAAETTYNAYCYELTYDADKLLYSDVSVGEGSARDGVLTVLGYGADKACGNDTVTVSFTAKEEGTATVTLTSAHVDKAAHASVQDAPVATITAGNVAVDVVGYSVDLPDGFRGAATVSKGQDYTFTAENPYYDYTVSATMDGKSVTVEDNGDGSYTIRNVTGKLVITVGKTSKTYGVTLENIGAYPLAEGEVTFAGTASYGVDYTFAVNEDEKSVYLYRVSALVNGTKLTFKKVENNVYTIAGGDITGDIVLQIEKVLHSTENATLAFEGTALGDILLTDGGYAVVDNIYQIAPGQEVSFTLRKEPNYTYTVKLNGQVMTESNGVYVLPGTAFVKAQRVTVTVEKMLNLQNGTVAAYVSAGQAGYVYRVSATIYTVAGQTLFYDGEAMYLRESENGLSTYEYLILSATELTWEKDWSKITLQNGAAGSLAGAVCDINSTGLVDVNDAQFVYDMYNQAYGFSGERMSKFLRADVNGDGKLSVDDCAAIIDHILTRG